eukprot:15176797-Alexandrium_andersonii.AAC.1
MLEGSPHSEDPELPGRRWRATDAEVHRFRPAVKSEGSDPTEKAVQPGGKARGRVEKVTTQGLHRSPHPLSPERPECPT